MTTRAPESTTSTPAPALSIVIPVFNGEQTISLLVEELSGLEIEGGLEVVLVNDGSADDSSKVCRDLVKSASVPVIFVDLARNFGEHNAVLAGLSYASGHYIITMDDDLQNPPGEVKRLYEHTVAQDHDISYTHFREKQHQAWRNMGSKLANLTANFVLDKPPEIYLSSFRCMKGFVKDAIIQQSSPFPHVDGLIFQVTQRVRSLEVEHFPNQHQRRNYTLRRLIRLWISILVGFSVKPLRVSTAIGSILTLLGIIGTFSVLAEYIFGGIPVQGWASLMIVVLLFSGVQLLMLGLIGEYLGRIYIMESGKPQFVIRSVHLSGVEGEIPRRRKS